MKKTHVKSIINSLLTLNEWKRPSEINSCLKHREIMVDLLKGEVLGSRKESIWKFYHEKVDWFKAIIKKLNGNLKDFQKANIYVNNITERIEIKYKNEVFSGKIILK